MSFLIFHFTKSFIVGHVEQIVGTYSLFYGNTLTIINKFTTDIPININKIIIFKHYFIKGRYCTICKINNAISARGGVSAGDNHGQSTTFGNDRSYSDIAKAYGGTVLMPNGDKYHGGKLVSFISSSGERHRVRTNADRCR